MRTPTRNALSLIEVVLAIVVLGLAIPPLVIQIGTGVRQQEAALVQQNLTQLAAERVWEIAADHADPARGYAYIEQKVYPDETDPAGLKGYQRRTTIREVSPADFLTPQAGSGIKRFQVVVTGPGDRSFMVESFVTNVAGTTDPGSGPGEDTGRAGRGGGRRGGKGDGRGGGRWGGRGSGRGGGRGGGKGT
jgi:type II secretory pathway pseudopilin PulG